MRNLPKANIFSILLELSLSHKIIFLCHIAKVSISGYYKHKKLLKSDSTKQEREQSDKLLIEHITKTRKKGYRRVTMELQKQWIIMNHKKVLRLMRKYDMLAKVRRRNPYKNISKATQEHKIKKNILKRDFWWGTPLSKLGTDITYIWEKRNWKYLSIIRDIISGEILSHILSRHLWLEGTLESMEILEKKLWKNQCKGILLHSDQGWHYTHPSYQEKLKKLWILQSMSRKWNCLDNAPTESFFGHMKDELEITGKETFEELKHIIDLYIFEYNHNRPQWNKKKMTPVEYRNHLSKNTN